MVIYQQVRSADIFQFMQQMFSSEYKANYWAMNSDLFLHAIIKSEGEIPHQQAEVTRPEILLLWMRNCLVSLKLMILLAFVLFLTSNVLISSFNTYIFMFKQCYSGEYNDEEGIICALKMYAI